MTFSSLVFLFIFLPAVFFLYVICVNTTVRNVLLVAASLLFYAFGEPIAVLIMIISIILNYLFGIMCAKDNTRKIAVVLAVVLNIGILIVFKYLGFLVSTFDDLTGLSVPIPNIALPIGISFFTFQGLSYVIDVYRDKNIVQRNLLYVFLYISFFPQLIAGPIVKYHDISEQLENRVLDSDRIYRGIRRFIIGLGKKVIIANQMGYMADLVFNSDVTVLGASAAWIGAICYTFQIFFDFSGYSDMAIGLGCMFGFDFMENFKYPLIATSIKDFWRRWHISLSTWFKEYVYIPLGGNRNGKARTYTNKFIVFILTGIWHGANFTFIVWGLAHGVLMVIEGLIEDFVGKQRKRNIFVSMLKLAFTFMFVVLTFVIFRADSISQGLTVIGHMFGAGACNAGATAIILGNINGLFIVALIGAILFSTPVVPALEKKLDKTKYKYAYDVISACVTMLIFVFCILLLISSGYNPFIYFRF